MKNFAKIDDIKLNLEDDEEPVRVKSRGGGETKRNKITLKPDQGTVEQNKLNVIPLNVDIEKGDNSFEMSQDKMISKSGSPSKKIAFYDENQDSGSESSEIAIHNVKFDPIEEITKKRM
jgi:hypothetical protein